MRFYDRTIDVSEYPQYDIHIKRNSSHGMTSANYYRGNPDNKLKPWMLLDVEDDMELTVEHTRKPEMNEGIEEPSPVDETTTKRKK